MNSEIYSIILDIGSRESSNNHLSKNSLVLDGVPFSSRILESYYSEFATIFVENGFFESLTDLTGKGQRFYVTAETKGALATSALVVASKVLENYPIILCPGDSLLDSGIISDFVRSMIDDNCDAGTIVFNSTDPNYSYVRVNKNEEVVEVAEKKVIGSFATAGVFYFKCKSDFLLACRWIFINNYSIGGNFFIAPALNYYIMNNLKVKFYKIKPTEYKRVSNKFNRIG